MTIYLDKAYRCHTFGDGTMMPVETERFVDKCPQYIEGYRFIPAGERWTNPDGYVFSGEMVAPWKPYEELDAIQRIYDRQRIADMETALHTLGVTLDG